MEESLGSIMYRVVETIGDGTTSNQPYRFMEFTGGETLSCDLLFMPSLSCDYEGMKNSKQNIHRELIEYLHHPRFIKKWLLEDNNVLDYLEY